MQAIRVAVVDVDSGNNRNGDGAATDNASSYPYASYLGSFSGGLPPAELVSECLNPGRRAVARP